MSPRKISPRTAEDALWDEIRVVELKRDKTKTALHPFGFHVQIQIFNFVFSNSWKSSVRHTDKQAIEYAVDQFVIKMKKGLFKKWSPANYYMEKLKD